MGTTPSLLRPLAAAATLVAILALTAPVQSGPSAAAPRVSFGPAGDSGRPCPKVDASGPTVTGGCELHARGDAIDLRVRTALGGFRLGLCQVYLTLHVGDDGTTYVDNVLSIGEPWPCDHIRQCAPTRHSDDVPLGGKVDARHQRPWKGRLVVRGDRLVNRFRMCADTCLGRYEGVAEISLHRRGDAWRARADSAGVGMSGLRIDGRWELVGGLSVYESPQPGTS
jgi:hypothetical protein